MTKSRIVQRRNGDIYDSSNITNDTPVADRLDRSYFGFDQDYFEQMPLLVNAMQENSYIDPDISAPSKLDKRGRYVKTHHSKHYELAPIRRTSPRPFIFEYRHPTPSPFHKIYNSRSWVENYRNAQRMKNLEQVITYLEKTINAKFGDLYSFPSSTHIAFSGLYVQPGENKVENSSPSDLMSQGSDQVQKVNKGHNHQQSDMLFSFKPESPGDVNLLADAPLKFAPPPPLSLMPMFRPGPNTKGCVGIRCGKQKVPNLLNIVSGSAEIKTTNPSLFDKANTFSVIMNLIPMTTTTPPPVYTNVLTTTMLPLDQIYFTTSYPQFQFRRKSTGPIFPRRPFMRRRRPKAQKKTSSGFVERPKPESADERGANMILTVKVFPKADGSTTENPPAFTPVLNSTQVEDYHVGSSGIIPVDLRSTTTQLPQVTLTPFFDEQSSSSEIRAWSSTNPPDILKFGQEDAKVPDHYRRIQEIQDTYRNYQPEIDRRNSKESYTVSTERIEKHESPRTIIVNMNNEDVETTTLAELDSEDVIDEPDSTTTVKTYVPQINGHSRHININSRNINNWLTNNSEKRKSKLEIKVTGHRTYVPTYVEIRRSRNKSDNN